MAETVYTPGRWDVTLWRGDTMASTVTISGTDLSTEGWRGQIRTSRSADEIVDEITIDASGAGDGVLLIEFPDLPVGRYVYDLECVGDRTYLTGSINVVRDVSRDDD